MKAAKLPVSVLVVIYTPAREVLLIRRADHAEFWQSVTGSVDSQDASLRDTAAREVQEETGLSVQPAELQDWGIANVYELYPAWRHRYAQHGACVRLVRAERAACQIEPAGAHRLAMAAMAGGC